MATARLTPNRDSSEMQHPDAPTIRLSLRLLSSSAPRKLISTPAHQCTRASRKHTYITTASTDPFAPGRAHPESTSASPHLSCHDLTILQSHNLPSDHDILTVSVAPIPAQTLQPPSHDDVIDAPPIPLGLGPSGIPQALPRRGPRSHSTRDGSRPNAF